MILTIYMSYDVLLCKELPFGGCNHCTCFTNFRGVTFL